MKLDPPKMILYRKKDACDRLKIELRDEIIQIE